MTRLLHRRSIRSTVVGVAAVVAVACVAAGAISPAAAAPRAAAASGEAATALAPAERMGMVAPTNFPMATTPRCQILNNFGDGRSGGRAHAGIDILATKDQEVYAMAAGTLVLQVVDGSSQPGANLSGNLWQLTAASGGTYYIYAHLSSFAPGLTLGSRVLKGQLIGYVGDTGNPGAGNYHLHFEIHPGGGSAVDPLPLLRPLPTGCAVYG
jgi:murein DD-endopeptidase MepM/ murein hydrolase activator NlpD